MYRPLDCGDGAEVLAYGQSHHRDYINYVRAGLKCLLHLRKRVGGKRHRPNLMKQI